MEAPFKIGQKVVALVGGKGHVFNKGDVFEVLNLKHCSCGEWSIDIGIKIGEGWYGVRCRVCGNCTDTIIRWFSSYLFAPIQDQYADITAEIAAGVTETKEQPDKVIIPAKPETAPCENSFS